MIMIIHRAYVALYNKAGKIDNKNGPAKFEIYGFTWYRNNEIHRSDGPAKLYSYSKKREWFLLGIEIGKDFNKWIDRIQLCHFMKYGWIEWFKNREK